MESQYGTCLHQVYPIGGDTFLLLASICSLSACLLRKQLLKHISIAFPVRLCMLNNFNFKNKINIFLFKIWNSTGLELIINAISCFSATEKPFINFNEEIFSIMIIL